MQEIEWHNYIVNGLDRKLEGASIVQADKVMEVSWVDHELYQCLYDLEKRDSFKSYDGLLKLSNGIFHFDFDGKETNDVDPLLPVWEEVKDFCSKLVADNVDFVIYFSGSKGFHVAVHESAFGGIGVKPKKEMETLVKGVYKALAETYSSTDSGIWNANRKFRIQNSKHPKTGLYKVALRDLGRKISELTIAEIKEIAKKPRDKSYYPQSGKGSGYLIGIKQKVEQNLIDTLSRYQDDNHSQKESTQPLPEELDGFEAHRAFQGKKCIQKIEKEMVALPGFSRHNIGLRLMVDLFHQGVQLTKAEKRITAWATTIFSGDQTRIQDTIRQLHEIYLKPHDYKFGCYDDIKKAYCSGKCSIYPTLNPKHRAMALDATKKLTAQNLSAQLLEESGPSEGELADKILESMGDLCTSNQDYFQWIGTHWKRFDRDRFLHGIKQHCMEIYQNKASMTKIESLFRHTLAKIPVAPENNCFFTASSNKFNFLDGTLWVHKDKKGRVKTELKKHDPLDMLAYCAPFPLYEEHKLPNSGDFKHYIETREKVMDKDGLLALKQLFGAALVPYEPRIFFLLGTSNTGKSTAAVLIEQLLGSDNVANCDPTSDYLFEWESAIGKLANIRKELPAKKPLQDNVLKEVRDKSPISINRKGIKNVKATLPFLHIYCCNKMPPSLEGNTGALDNRITLLKFKPTEINGFGHISNLGSWLWEVDAGGVLDFAREGLKSLIENDFIYAQPKESKNSLAEWQDQGDAVKLFVELVEAGALVFGFDAEKSGWYNGLNIYAVYKDFCVDNGYKVLSSGKFYLELLRFPALQVKRGGKGKLVFWADVGKKKFEDAEESSTIFRF